jgi:CheY-like chemotaxis protein
MPQSESVRLPGKQSLRETDIILIIEDDMCNGEFLVELILEETLFYPIHLVDSAQALKLTQLLKPKLLICDYFLPKMNGIMLYDRLHSNIELQKMPILIVSARLEGLEREIKERGLVTLSKPFDLEEFFAAIEKVMGYDIRLPDRFGENALSEQLI